jgi:hypothetical protein
MAEKVSQPRHIALLTRAHKIANDCELDLMEVEENVHLLKTILKALAKHPKGSAERKGYSAIVPALVTAIVTRLYAICFDATKRGKSGRTLAIMRSDKSCFSDAVYLIKGGDRNRDAARCHILRQRSYLDARWERRMPVLLIRDSSGKITDELRLPAKEVRDTLCEKRKAMDEAIAAWVALGAHPAFKRLEQSRHHTFSHNIKKVDAMGAYGLTFPQLTDIAERATVAMTSICVSHFGFSSDLAFPRRGDRFLAITEAACSQCGRKIGPTVS